MQTCHLEQQTDPCHDPVLQGQIHARADVRGEEHDLPRLGATRHSAELFLQAEVTLENFYDDSAYGNNAVRGGSVLCPSSSASRCAPTTAVGGSCTSPKLLSRIIGSSQTQSQ
jgi:hypothetical protein